MMKILARFSRFGVLGREGVKNDATIVLRMVRNGLVKKVYKNGRVFYELTEKALPLVEQRRKMLLEELKLNALFEPHLGLLVEDVRFLDEHSPEAEEFLFLGDWQLARPVVPAQLELARLRFYSEKVPRRSRRRKAA